MIEVRYAGVVVGRSSIIRELDTRGLFLGMTEPLPLGTAVDLKIDEHTVAGRVEHVSESQELARAGMRVRFSHADSAIFFGIPVEAPPEVAPPLWFSTQPAAPIAQAVVNGDGGAPQAPAPSTPSGPRRIVVDASSEKPPEGPGDEASGAAADASDADAGAPEAGPEVAADGRIPAPDPSALGAGGGARKNRRNRRR
jgi:hypothetical protein